jgi:hypothetical protein
VRVGPGDVCGKFIIYLRNPQKIEWRLHLYLPFDPKKIQNFAQKEVRKLLQKDTSKEEETRSMSREN